MGLMRKLFRQETVNGIWQKSSSPECLRGPGCPSCTIPMHTVVHMVAQKAQGFFDLDVCRLCPLVWFDTKELEVSLKVGGSPPSPGQVPLNPKVKEAIAMMEIEMIREQANHRENGEITWMGHHPEPPRTWWEVLLTVMGIPVVEDEAQWSRWPWVTCAALLLVFATFAASLFFPDQLIELAFRASTPWKYGGLTFFLSFFLHADWIHLLMNSAFLGVFGARCEDYLGHIRLLLLLLISAAAGPLLHLLLDPRSDIPLVGASAGISGVVAFYALQFPSARLIYFLRIGIFFRWVRVPAIVGFAIWLILQIWGASAQTSALGNVSFLGHLGGAGAGILYWAILKFSPETFWRNDNRAPLLSPIKEA